MNCQGEQRVYRIGKWKQGRFWSLTDGAGRLVCVCVYKKGASEVKRLLEEREEFATRYALGKEAVG